MTINEAIDQLLEIEEKRGGGGERGGGVEIRRPPSRVTSWLFSLYYGGIYSSSHRATALLLPLSLSLTSLHSVRALRPRNRPGARGAVRPAHRVGHASGAEGGGVGGAPALPGAGGGRPA